MTTTAHHGAAHEGEARRCGLLHSHHYMTAPGWRGNLLFCLARRALGSAYGPPADTPQKHTGGQQHDPQRNRPDDNHSDDRATVLLFALTAAPATHVLLWQIVRRRQSGRSY